MASEELALREQEARVVEIEDLIRAGDAAMAKQEAASWVTKAEESGTELEKALALVSFAKARAACGEQESALAPAKEALEIYKAAGNAKGEADCMSVMAKIYLDLEDSGQASELCDKALKIYKAQGDRGAQGRALLIQAGTLRQEGASTDALRMSELADQCLQQAGDFYSEVESTILQAQMKLIVAQEAYDGKSPLTSSVVSLAKAALGMAKSRRPNDFTCSAEAGLCLAQAHFAIGAYATAAKHAKEAASDFRRAGDQKKRGRAMLVFASSEARGGNWRHSLKICQQATAILDEADDEVGRGMSFAVLDDVDASRRISMGLPSREEEEKARQKELQEKRDKEAEQQQQQMMMMMMQMQMMQGGGGAMPQMQMPKAAPRAAPAASQAQAHAPAEAITVKKGDALHVTAGMDAAPIRAKILEIATQIIGDDEGIDGDMPLMQAGLTSNTAVLLRDELNSSLPGVNLPPTLMFDYPSISAIADFIVEKVN
jgi:tetratricopeptide (TPR) repeat protein